MIPNRLSAAVTLACALALVGCEKNESTAAATPAPTPAPAPAAAPTFTVSGTIFETSPTASTRVGDAEVQLSGGVATGSTSDGSFTIPNVTSGTYSLRIAKAAYETQTRTVTVTGANLGGIVVNLLPVFRWVDREFTAELREGNSACNGTTRPCHVYSFASHHSGEVRAFLAWDAPTTDFDFEYWCDGSLVEARGIKGGDHDEILPRIDAGQTCEIHVLHSGSPMRYTLYLRYPY